MPSAQANTLDNRLPQVDATELVERKLKQYKELSLSVLLEGLPKHSPAYLYDLLPTYPKRPAKGLRAALCLATCRALGGAIDKALNSAAAIELFHNAFLIHDDVQDASELRRGEATLQATYGPAIAVNVGNATNLAGLERLMRNRSLLGAQLSWRIFEETHEMMRHSLEGQAIELGWIRDNVCSLSEDDYYRMCLKKTSWYTCIYPCRIGALIALSSAIDLDRFYHFGWYLGAAFQIQDDILNLVGNLERYGKEISGDLWEGKRTLMLIHVLEACAPQERQTLINYLAKQRHERTAYEVSWLHDLVLHYGSIEFARKCARQLAGAALHAGLKTFAAIPDSEDKQFILALPLYVINRDR